MNSIFDPCLYYNLNVLNRKVGKIWQDEFKHLGLTPSQGYLLFAIADDSSLTQKELSDLLELDQSTMTRFIESLVEKGLIKKHGKGKGSKLEVTPKGKREHQRISSLMDKLYRNMEKKIGQPKFENFVGHLRGLRQIFDKENSDE